MPRYDAPAGRREPCGDRARQRPTSGRQAPRSLRASIVPLASTGSSALGASSRYRSHRHSVLTEPGYPGPTMMSDPKLLRPLVVDLDGTLCARYLVGEFFAAWRLHWWLPLAAPMWLLRGRSALKQRLATWRCRISPVAWNAPVIDALRTARAAGRQTVLATAADARVAHACAAQVGLFDRIIASDGVRNLKAGAKAEQLLASFGEQGFDYIGDSRADLAVWPHAAQRLTVSSLLPDGGQRLPDSPPAGACCMAEAPAGTPLGKERTGICRPARRAQASSARRGIPPR